MVECWMLVMEGIGKEDPILLYHQCKLYLDK